MIAADNSAIPATFTVAFTSVGSVKTLSIKTTNEHIVDGIANRTFTVKIKAQHPTNSGETVAYSHPFGITVDVCGSCHKTVFEKTGFQPFPGTIANFNVGVTGIL